MTMTAPLICTEPGLSTRRIAAYRGVATGRFGLQEKSYTEGNGGLCVTAQMMPVVMPPPAEHLILPRADEISGLADARLARTRSRTRRFRT